MLSGSIVEWGDDMVDQFDLIVVPLVATDVRLGRLRRYDGGNLPHDGAVNDVFVDWASQYDEGGLKLRSRSQHAEWLGRRVPPVLRVEGELSVQKAVDRTVASLRAALDAAQG